jgi:hypothetical protein
MARSLNIKQKKILDCQSARFSDELPPHIRQQLEKIKVYENMDTDMDRYLTDKHFNTLYKRG